MSAVERMEPLERHYRRLLRLLPADHRAARGDELLGLLLDLDSGRTRPSSRQAAGVVVLALRYRLPGAAVLLLTAFLIAFSTEIAATGYKIGTGAMTISVDSEYPIQNATVAVLIPALLRLAVAVAWILGARRTTLIACIALLLFFAAAGGGPLVLDLAIGVGLGVAAALRWPTPRSRVALLAAIPLAMLLWVVSAVWDMPLSLHLLLSITAAVALLGSAGAVVLGRVFGKGSNDGEGRPVLR
jgi:hypothetical protein